MIAVGAGCSAGCPPEELLALVTGALADAGVRPGDVAALASIDLKAEERALLAAAELHDWPLAWFTAAQLRDVPVATPSSVVASHVGTPSVAEAAALLAAAPARLVVTKRRSAHATCAVARRTT